MEELLKKLEILIGTIEKSQSSEGEEIKKNLATLMEEVKKAGLTEEDKTRLAKMEELEKEIKKQAETIDGLMKKNTTVLGEETELKKFEDDLNKYCKTGIETEIIKKAFNTTAGGVLIPSPRANEIIKEAMETSPVLAAAKRYTTSANTLMVPVKGAGTNNAAAQAEGTGAGTASELAYTKLELKAGKITDWVNVTAEMIDDADFNVLNEVMETLRENIAYYLSEKVWNGVVGSNNEIEGIYKNSAVTSEALTTKAGLTWEDLKDLIYSMPPKTRAKSSFYVSTSALSLMRGFKDADGRPLYTESLVAGEPGIFMGYRVYEDTYMDEVANNKYPVFFGNMKDFYAWLDRKGMYMERARHEKEDTWDFILRTRIGGKVRQKSQGKLLKISGLV